jgi:hypothetical protein
MPVSACSGDSYLCTMVRGPQAESVGNGDL